MDPNKPNQGQQNPGKGNQQDLGRKQTDQERVGSTPDRSTADDRSSGADRQRSGEHIPELDEPDVEGVGNESGTDLNSNRDQRSRQKPGSM